MTFFKKAMTYLGLGDDDEYDDYDAPPLDRSAAGRRPSYGPEDQGTVRTIPPRDRPPRDPTGERSATRPPAGPEGAAPTGAGREGRRPSGSSSGAGTGAAVRPVPVNAKPHTVTPHRFDQAQEVADRFKEGAPVIVNLQAVDKDLSRRLIDFASGLCYGLNGSMERVAQGVYLLTPVGVSVSDEDRRPGSDDGG